MLPKEKSAFLTHIRGLVALNGGEVPVFAAHAVRSTLATATSTLPPAGV